MVGFDSRPNGGFEGRHKACPYRCCVGIAVVVMGRHKGRHKACPYRCCVGIAVVVMGRHKGRHKACPTGAVWGLW